MSEIEELLEKLDQQTKSIASLQDQIRTVQRTVLTSQAPSLARKPAIGEDVRLGSYMWKAIDEKDGLTLLISRECVCERSYSTIWDDTDWETSPLRQWLNEYFLETSFSQAERAAISTTTVITPDNPFYGTSGGNITYDRVFLLSVQEAEHYSKAVRGFDIPAGWWARTPGDRQNTVICILSRTEAPNYAGGYVDYVSGVRPALWVRFEE